MTPIAGEWFVPAPRWARVGPFFGGAFIVVVGVTGLVDDPHPFWVLWLGFGALILVPQFRSPYEARIDTSGMLHIRAIARTLMVPAAQVRAVRGTWWNYYGYVLETAETKVWFFLRLRESFDFISALKTHNPSLVVEHV